MFRGSMVALATPMTSTMAIDEDALAKLLEMHVECGTDALVVLGTTGEAATILPAEQDRLITFVVEKIGGRIPIIAGTAAVSTAQAVEKTQHAMHHGVDGCLIMAPPYVKPTQEGLYQHFKTIAEQVAIPQIIYNVPGRTACDISADTVERLAHISNIIGIKEATGDMARAQEILSRCGDGINLYSGDDPTALPLMMLGGKGVISVTANVAPKLMSQLCASALAGDYERALMLNEKLAVLHKRLHVEANPIPLKWCLQEMGLIKAGIRLPLTPLSSVHYPMLREAMQKAELL